MQDTTEVKEDVRVRNEQGLHARPAAKVVQTALKFKSDVYISHNGNRINAKSIMGILTLAAGEGTVLSVSCKGPDAEEAMGALRELFKSKFGEQ